jgi:hypothetical protein
LAEDLIRYGRQHKSPEALITAAKILGTTAVEKRTDEPKLEKGEKDKTKAQPRHSPKALLAEAKKMADGDAAVSAMADAVAKEIARKPLGAVGGPIKSLHVCPAFGTQSFRVTYRAGELAVCIMDGDGSTDLDIFIYDENGNLIASDVGLSDYARLTWVPRWTGPFVIRISNLGSRANAYYIITN